MSDQDITHKQLEKIKNDLQACREWFRSTFSQPYTAREMTDTLAYYLVNHLFYYSNILDETPENQQRIMKIQDRFKKDIFKRQQDFNIANATTPDKKNLLRREIVRYEQHFIPSQLGVYYKDDIELVIHNLTDAFNMKGGIYLEHIFDKNIEVTNQVYYDFFSDVLFIQYLRNELIKLEGPPPPQYDSFPELFKGREVFNKVIDYLKSIYVLDQTGIYIEKAGNKKYLAILPDVLRRKSKLRTVTDKEFVRLMKQQFGIKSFSVDYISKYFPNRDELTEEMVKDLRL